MKPQSLLIQSLRNPALFPHKVESFKLIETHISWVLLTGDFAYKIKKPLNLGFLDFSTLEKRRHYCFEELRLDARLARIKERTQAQDNVSDADQAVLENQLETMQTLRDEEVKNSLTIETNQATQLSKLWKYLDDPRHSCHP